MSLTNQLRVLSANCQGLRDKTKQADVLDYFDHFKANIICLQDTHLTPSDENHLRSIFDCECYLNGYKTNSRGVAILLKNNFEHKVVHTDFDNDGNLITIDLNLENISIRLINIYAPNVDSPSFFENVRKLVDENEQDYILVSGDFNLVLNPDLDSFNYININNPKSRLHLLETMQLYNLKDAFRTLHPTVRRYTWRRKKPVKQARLDYFVCSDALVDLMSDCRIQPGYRSDHSILEIGIILNSFKRGRGLWKFNCSLLQNKDYIHEVNKTIEEVKLRYCSPVYSPQFVTKNHNFDLQFTIDLDLLLEMMLLKIRDITIKFSVNLKKEAMKEEKELIQEIKNIELNAHDEHYHANLETKQTQLQKLRRLKLNGSMIRSKARWLQFGEKPTKYFCALEKRNFVDKTIKKLTLETGETVLEQHAILDLVKHYYASLFKSRDNEIDDTELETLLDPNEIVMLSEKESNSLEGLLTIEELGTALKKNEKKNS